LWEHVLRVFVLTFDVKSKHIDCVLRQLLFSWMQKERLGEENP
jgi:hypothetical protein